MKVKLIKSMISCAVLGVAISGCTMKPDATEPSYGAYAFVNICMDALPDFEQAIENAKENGINNFGYNNDHFGNKDEDFLLGVNNDGSLGMFLRQYSETSEWCRVSTPHDTSFNYGPSFYELVENDLKSKGIKYTAKWNHDKTRIKSITAIQQNYEMRFTHVSRGGELFLVVVKNDYDE